MTYKEFVEWANKRACDGFWSMQVAVISADICSKMSRVSVFHRKKAWEEYRETAEAIVDTVEARLKELRGNK